ncbi:hypothetical protein, partial [uncultured Streptococcus sp.]|uniref:hypothetical protein n=1 Tax=uncultured Streptococcus sp. TaxID=83427 RepID=UPI00258F1A25
WDFLCTLKKLYNLYSGFTHYRNYRAGYTSTAAACLQFFSFLTGQPESPFYAKIKVLRFKKEMR